MQQFIKNLRMGAICRVACCVSGCGTVVKSLCAFLRSEQHCSRPESHARRTSQADLWIQVSFLRCAHRITMRLIADRLGAIWKACVRPAYVPEHTATAHYSDRCAASGPKITEVRRPVRGSTLRRVRGFVGDVYEDRISSNRLDASSDWSAADRLLPSPLQPG